jgi:hypothetical protein
LERAVRVNICELPDDALSHSYKNNGDYTDCFAIDVDSVVGHEQFVRAFYTSWPFKLERTFLSIAILKPSSDAQAAQLAAGTLQTFSAWTVEARTANQLLMCDYQKKTRSWLMVTPTVVDNKPGTRLYFGSVVIAAIREANAAPKLSLGFRALLGYHKNYSKVLLRAAAARCLREVKSVS